MTQKSLYEQFLDGIGHAITDIREKVVEEPWYGRVVTGHGHEPQTVWQEKVQQAAHEAPTPDISINDALGMDR